jgi:hypothetical protein
MEQANQLEDLSAELDQARLEGQGWKDAAERAAEREQQALAALRDSHLRVRLLTEQLEEEDDSAGRADVAFREGATWQADRDKAALHGTVCYRATDAYVCCKSIHVQDVPVESSSAALVTPAWSS